MKFNYSKAIATILSTLMALSLYTSVNATTEDPNEKFDLNSNGYIDSEDLNIHINYVLGKIDFPTGKNLDYNNDGKVDSADTTILLRNLFGDSTPCPTDPPNQSIVHNVSIEISPASFKAGDIVTVTVRINNTLGLATVEYWLKIDPNMFSIDNGEDTTYKMPRFCDTEWLNSIQNESMNSRFSDYGANYVSEDHTIRFFSMRRYSIFENTDNMIIGKFNLTVKDGISTESTLISFTKGLTMDGGTIQVSAMAEPLPVIGNPYTLIKSGDVTLDYKVDSNDAVWILKYLNHSMEFTDTQMALADFNHDTVINENDVSDILKYELGL